MLTVAPVIVNDAVVAPVYTPVLVTSVKVPLGTFTCHLYVKLEPVATAVKVVLSPSHIVLSVGCVVIAGRSRTVIILVYALDVPQGLEIVNVSV